MVVKGKVQGFIEYVCGFSVISKIGPADMTLERVAYLLRDTWIAGVPYEGLPRFGKMNGNIELDGLVEAEHVQEFVQFAKLRSPYGFTSQHLFVKSKPDSLARRIKSDFAFFFDQQKGYEADNGVALAVPGLLVAARFGDDKRVIVAADLNNLAVDKMNRTYDEFKSKLEKCVDTDEVKAWAAEEFAKAQQQIAKGVTIRNQAAYLRGLSYMAETGRVFSYYTLDGKKAVMPKFKPKA